MNDAPGLALLSDLAARHAAERPEAAAIVEDETVVSWAELDGLADRVARQLRDLATRPGGRVGLALGPTALGVVAVHAVARAGVTAILVNPRLTSREIGDILVAAAARSLAIDPSTGVEAPAGITGRDLSAGGGAGDGDGDGAGDGGRSGGRGAAAQGLGAPGSFVVPTSGTTARPKLACLPLDRLAASAAAWSEILPPATGWLLSLGLTHVAGLGIVVRAAAAGVAVVIPSAQDSAALLGAIEGARVRGITVSHASLVAAQLAGLLDAANGATPPDGIRAILLGGGPIPEGLVRRAAATGWPMSPSYGMTETASGVAAVRLDDLAAGVGTAGLPLPGAGLRLADDGEIHVRGPMVFAGYLDDPEATASASTSDGWLRTGDLGRLDPEGRLIVEGRRDDTIISGGENIQPAEVEAAIATHPAVREVAVTGIPDPTWGEVPAAIVVTEPGADPSDDELRAHARERLARFKVPARFVRVRELPRTSLGKVARPDLRRLAETGERRTTVTAADGQPIAVRELGSAASAAVVLLHATLSTSDQLMSLARRLAGSAHVILVDRRGSGASVMADPAPVPVARHVADVVAVLDTLGIGAATLVGHSFGGVVAIETAVDDPERVDAVVAWEPPFLPVAPESVRRGMAAIGDDVAAAFAGAGPESAARRFFEAVSGPGAWDQLHPRQRDAIARAGAGALADVAMIGLTVDGLERLARRTVILTGEASEPFYRPIADALAERIGHAAERIDLPGLRHMAPITDPSPIADLVLRHIGGTLDQETSA